MTRNHPQRTTTSRSRSIALIGSLLLAGPSVVWCQQAFNQPEETSDVNQIGTASPEIVAEAIADRWLGEAVRLGYSPADWRAELVGALQLLEPADLEQTLRAETYADLLALLRTGRVSGGETPASLVFAPVPACKLYDSRFATGDLGGPRAPGSNTVLRTRAPMTGQGGDEDCGLPSVDASAIAIHVSVVNYSGPGFLEVFPAGQGPPGVSVVSYGNEAAVWRPTSPDLRSNAIIVEQCTVCGDDSDIAILTATSATDVVVEVVGYFAPSPTTTVLSTEVVVPTGTSFTLSSPPCPAGAALTGGGLNYFGPTNEFWIWQSSPDGTSGSTDDWRCRGFNENTTVGATVTCYAICTSPPAG